MKKSTKGAVAGAAAALLLMGGLGTHAAWTGGEDVAGGTFKSGWLTLSSDCASAKWLLSDLTEVTSDVDLIPGDVLTKSCTFTVSASTRVASATVTASSPTYTTTNDLTDALDVKTEFVQGTTVPSGFTVHDGDTFTANFTVTLPSDASDLVQAKTAAMEGITVTATQA